jgi:hypothetical protein
LTPTEIDPAYETEIVGIEGARSVYGGYDESKTDGMAVGLPTDFFPALRHSARQYIGKTLRAFPSESVSWHGVALKIQPPSNFFQAMD